MQQKALSIYYGLALLVVMTAGFVLFPSNQPDVKIWQFEMERQVVVAWKQTMGDQSWFSDLSNVYDGVNDFYSQSADSAIALIDQPEADSQLIYVATEVYHDFVLAFHPHEHASPTGIAYNLINLPPPGSDFMGREPIYNIVPTGNVSGASRINRITPVNSIDVPWVTIQDNYTGQLYCLAVYNGTVNKYIGPCKTDNDYH